MVGKTDGSAPVETHAVTPVATRAQRRPLLLVVSVLLVLLGAAGGALAWMSIGTAVDAVVARTPIQRGQVLSADDFVVVQVNPDPQLQMIPPGQIPSLVGQRASHDVAAGGLVPTSVAAQEVLPPAGETVIGLSLAPGFYPAMDLLVGDQVRVVMVEPIYACAAGAPAATDSAAVPASSGCLDGQLTVPGVVVSVSMDSASSQLFLAVQVKQAAAATAASAAALGKAAVVLDTRER
ncbi:SAF domain-containing protein [Tessaracoccus antarcticus]|nr:SAF domain-containing protein [Tessaracoccus antarcticus]